MNTQELKYDLYQLRQPLFLLSLLLLLVALVYFFSSDSKPTATVEETAPLGDAIRQGVAPIPEYTDAMKAELEKGPDFHLLVSFTDNGFEPALASIKKGEVVRFTNNSSHNLWIAAHGGEVQIYPRTTQVCGSPEPDSCESFAPQDFWQFRFDVAGEWEVVNTMEKTNGGIIRVN